MAAATGVFCLRNDIDAFGTVVSGWALGMGHSHPGPAETQVRGKWVFLPCADGDGDNKVPGLRPPMFFFFFRSSSLLQKLAPGHEAADASSSHGALSAESHAHGSMKLVR